MALNVRNDEQIKVGTTTGLVAGASSFTFDGTSGKPDYRYYQIVPTELSGRGLLALGVDYSWNYTTGVFTLLHSGDVFNIDKIYNIHFQPVEPPASLSPASLINSSFFIRNLNIPNIETPVSPDTNKVLQRLISFIAKYEPECLQKILGYPLYKLFLTESSARMTELLYGAEYLDECGITQKWQGLVHDTDISLIANYIYFYYQEASASQTTGVNTSVIKGSQSVLVSPQDKMINAWNFFSSETKSMISFLWMKKDINDERVYPEFTAHQYLITKRLSTPINFMGI